jgi:hypothetical protein
MTVNDHVTIDIGEGAHDFDADNWARFPEVVNYATAKGISVPEAIVRLVNSGLSHESKVYL